MRESLIESPSNENSAAAHLGMRLRHSRIVKNLRLRDVAERSELSEGLISKFENNKATPSLNTLHKLARVLGTTIAELLAESPDATNIVMRKGQRPVVGELAMVSSQADGTDAEVLVPFGSSNLLEAFLIRVQPGGSSAGDRRHQGEEVGYVVKGEIELIVDGQLFKLKEGDSFYFASHLPHRFANPGEVTAEVIWVNTPASL
jgi:transcriptional regulator with XRE-family HTH domain